MNLIEVNKKSEFTNKFNINEPILVEIVVRVSFIDIRIKNTFDWIFCSYNLCFVFLSFIKQNKPKSTRKKNISTIQVVVELLPKIDRFSIDSIDFTRLNLYIKYETKR